MFAVAFCQVRPNMQKNDLQVCTRYDKLHDLVSGAIAGCHLCIITMEDIKRRLDFEDEEWPLWLRSPTKDSPSDGDASGMSLSTRIRTHAGEAHISLKIKPMAGTEEQAELSSFLPIVVRNTLATPKTTCSTMMERVQLSDHIGSDVHYHLIQKWINACADRAQHRTCSDNGTIRRPTRLLDLAQYHEDVRLVQGAFSTEPYAALSYCWGAVPQLMLLPSNLQQFQERTPFASFSQVSKDAIAVCRKLSIRYLWIDALCIVQGKDGDFLTEAPRMKDVYGGSILTIVAASSRDSTESFLTRRNPLEWLDCELCPTEDIANEAYWVSPDFYCEDGEPGEYHIDSRAWCLQERLMSPRSIYFGKKGVHWECRQGIACELRPEIERNHNNLVIGSHDTYGLKSEYAELQSLQPKNVSDVARAELIWRHVLKAYSLMSITHIEDKLIAISGVASALESKFNWRSTYGLWTDFIVPELLWQSVSRDFTQKDEAATKLFPSWSWTSSNGHPIRTEYPRRLTHGTDDFYMATAISWPQDSGFGISLFQDSKDKILCIRGLLVPCKKAWTEVGNDKPDHRPADYKGHGYMRSYHPDPSASEVDLFCLLLLCQNFPGDRSAEYRNHGLVLTPVKGGQDCFRRTGIIVEDFSQNYLPDAPSSQRVRGRFLTDMWAPVGKEQNVCIV